jgi:hypothetical protein
MFVRRRRRGTHAAMGREKTPFCALNPPPFWYTRRTGRKIVSLSTKQKLRLFQIGKKIARSIKVFGALV